MPNTSRHHISKFYRLIPVFYKLPTLCLFAAYLFPIAHAENTSKAPVVNVFTTPWSRLFSGSESSFSAALTYNVPLERTMTTTPTGRESSETRKTLNQRGLLSLQYSPLSYFFANTTFGVPLREVNKYSTNFSYSFGYDDWHPGTYSFIYSNYSQDNHLFTQTGRSVTTFEKGAFTVAYKFRLPEKIESKLLINKEDNLGCQVGYTYSHRYFDNVSNTTKNNKNILLASCGYTVKGHYFARLSGFYYPEKTQQQPWDSDYTYSFGYVSGYKPGSISVRYDNYSGTRYPWRGNPKANFRSGTVSVSWILPF